LQFSENRTFAPLLTNVNNYAVSAGTTAKIYVRAYDDDLDCYTPDANIDSITITVNATPTLTITGDTVRCSLVTEVFNLEDILLTETGGWAQHSLSKTGPWFPAYDPTQNISVAVGGSLKLYVQAVNGACKSDIDSVTFRVFELETPTFDINTVYCGDDIPALPTESNEGYSGTWNPATITVTGTYIFTPDPVQDHDCIQDVEIFITVLPNPIPPTVEQHQLFCDAATVADLNAHGVNITWYASETATTPVALDRVLQNGDVFFATQSLIEDGCESVLRSPVYVSIVDPSELPAPVVISQALCIGAMVADILTDGSNGIVILDMAGNILTPDYPLTSGDSYQAMYLYGTGSNTCQSATSTPFTITFFEPTTPVVYTDAQTFCEGATIANIEVTIAGTPVSNGSFVWYDTDPPVTPLAPNTVLTTGTYYGWLNNEHICGFSTLQYSVDITIGNTDVPEPIGPTEYTFCSPQILGTLDMKGYGVAWYTDMDKTIQLPLTYIIPVGRHTFYVEQRGTDTCESAQPLEVIVNVVQLAIETIKVQTEPSCSGDMGSIQFYVSGGSGNYACNVYRNNTLYISDVDYNTTGGLITGLTAGAYKVEVIDMDPAILAAECPGAASLDIVLRNTDNNLFVNIEATDAPTCDGTGTLELQISGGVPPYNATLNGTSLGILAPNTILTGIPVGVYIVEATDATGCIAVSREVRIGSPAAQLSATVITNQGTPCSQLDGEALVEVTSALPYYYQLNNTAIYGPFTVGASGRDQIRFEGLDAGEHNFRVFNDCAEENIRFHIANMVGSSPSGLSFTAVPQDLIWNNTTLTMGYIALEANGGTLPYEYSIDNGETWTKMTGAIDTIRNLTEGVYNVVLRDAAVPPCQYTQYLIRIEREIVAKLMDCSVMVDRNEKEDAYQACEYTHEGSGWDAVLVIQGVQFDSVQYYVNDVLISHGPDATLDGAKFPIGVSKVVVIAFLGEEFEICEFTVTVTRVCPETIEDEEGNTYTVTPLAGLCWTSNLKSTQYVGGAEIAWAKPYTSTVYPNEEYNKTTFGLLYTWYSAVGVPEGSTELPTPDEFGNIQGICPDGWHVPSQEEWDRLNAFSATDLKSTTLWINPGTNATGFNAFPAGWYNGTTKRFEDLYGYTGWWSSDNAPGNRDALHYYLNYYCDSLEEKDKPKGDGLSVRCVLDDECK
jgi:uncharacterized protein (TIGR02145 family)